MRLRRLGALVACIAVFSAAAPAQPRPSPKSDYEQLDDTELLNTLVELRMRELLEAFVQKYADGGDQLKSLRARIALDRMSAESARAAGAFDEFDKANDQAIEHMQALVKLAQDAAGDEDQVARTLEDRYRLCVTRGVDSIGPYVYRIERLHGSADDAAKIAPAAGEAVKWMIVLGRDVERQAEEWRGGDRRLVLIATGVIRQLETLQAQIEYKLAWIRYYHALTIDPSAEPDPDKARQLRDQREDLLTRAANAVSRYSLADNNDSGVKYWSLLLAGQTAREMGDYDVARDRLAGAGSAEADAEIRLNASFELAKTHVKQKRWPDALKQLEQFSGLGASILPAAQQIEVDLQSALLADYIYRERARAVRMENKGEDRAKALEAEGLKRLVSFLAKYPDPGNQLAFCIIYGNRFEGIPSANLSSLAKLAKGVIVRQSDPDEAIAYFRQVLNDDDASAKLVRPIALWNLAELLSDKPETRVEAAEDFRLLAEESPDHPWAYDSLQNSIKLMEERVNTYRKENRPVPADVRQKLIVSLELLLSKWPDKRETQQRNVELARHYKELGQPVKAIAAFERVPADSPNYQTARQEAMAMKVELLEADPSQPDLIGQATRLIDELGAYARSAKRLAEGISAAAAKDQQLRLGAEADYHVARVYKNLLKRPQRALDHLEGDAATGGKSFARRWPAQKATQLRAEALRIDAMGELGKTRQAGEALLALNQQAPAEAGRLASDLARQNRNRIQARKQYIETLDPNGSEARQVSQELVALIKNYRAIAEIALGAVKDASPAHQYPFRQMMAEAMLEFGEVDDAMSMFEELTKVNDKDALNLMGLARCHWERAAQPGAADSQGDFGKALELYRQLTDGVDARQYPELYWRVQYERSACSLDANQDSPENLKALRVRLTQLQAQTPDKDFGSPSNQKRFNALVSRIDGRIGSPN